VGLNIAVGNYADLLMHDEEGAQHIAEYFVHLNELLTENGIQQHNEPIKIAPDDYFGADMFSYSGIHALRRLAAYIALKGELPNAVEYGAYTDDPIYIEFNQIHDRYLLNPLSDGFMGFFRKKLNPPPFQHLIMHSDAEGFYIPQVFEEVVIDWSQLQRLGLGAMVGSSRKLLEECELLAQRLNLPEDFDPESEEFLDVLEDTPARGEPWQILAVEAHTAANLISAARASIKLGAAIQFC
jgi:hypothetical protein